MCGIVGVIGSRQAAPLILDSLRRLEYRGYDSAGIATLVNGHIERRRAEGKLGNLAAVLDRLPLTGTTGIGHTRWATHGAPTESNAHPHGTSRVSIVHNGIIENHAELRAELEAEGQEFTTETDTETVAQLVDLNLQRGMDPIAAAGAAFRRLEGAYALAMIFSGHPELIVGAQHGAPLAVGFGEDEMFVGSDGLALAPLTQRIAYLNDGDWAVVDRKGARFFDADGAEVQREVKLTRLTGSAIGKGNFRHFMEKELHEHPGGDRRHAAPHGQSRDARGGPARAAVRFRHAAAHHHQRLRQRLLCRHWSAAGGSRRSRAFRTDADVASEFRYRTPPLAQGGLGILVSQSGETADTMAALQLHARAGAARAVDRQRAGEQHGARIGRGAGDGGGAGDQRRQHQGVHRAACRCWRAWRSRLRPRARRDRRPAEEAAMTAALLEVPSRAAEVLDRHDEIKALAHRVAQARDVLYLGRGNCFPIAMEGALKLKEISYIHAEGYAAGEMKHGPIALIDKDVPVIAHRAVGSAVREDRIATCRRPRRAAAR